MRSRRFGFEIECRIVTKDNPREKVYPAFFPMNTLKKEGDTILKTGRIGKRLGILDGVGYKALYTFWDDWEIAVNPFVNRQRLTPLMAEVYEIMTELPERYQPWIVAETKAQPDGIIWAEKVIPIQKCRIIPNKLDVSIETTLEELGLRREAMPLQIPDDKYDGQWWVHNKCLPMGNTYFQEYVNTPLCGYNMRCQLRNINRAWVLESSFNMLEHGILTRDNMLEIAADYTTGALTALNSK